MINMKSMFVSMDQSNILNLKDVAVKAWLDINFTKEEIKSRSNCSHISRQTSVISWCTHKYAEKDYYKDLEDYQVNTLHFLI